MPDPKKARHLTASRRAEARYVLELLRVLGEVHRGILKVVEREHLWQHDLRHDAPFVGLTDKLLRRIFQYVTPQVQTAFDFMASEVEKSNAKGGALLGIRAAHVPGLESVIDHARQKNVALITRASEDFLAQVRDVLEENDGAHPDDLRALLAERVDVSKSRAQLIARDQTLKLNSQITQHRQRAAGVTQYRWSSSHDERVRPAHRELDGGVFGWDEPPETNDDGDRNHPGEDFQCRCVPIPVIQELEEPDEAAGEFEDEPSLGVAAEE